MSRFMLDVFLHSYRVKPQRKSTWKLQSMNTRIFNKWVSSMYNVDNMNIDLIYYNNFSLPDDREHSAHLVNRKNKKCIVRRKKTCNEERSNSSVKSDWIKVIFFVKKNIVSVKWPNSMAFSILKRINPINRCRNKRYNWKQKPSRPSANCLRQNVSMDIF